MTLQDFVSQNNNQFKDFDGYFGYQCWDLAAYYVRDVVGCPSLPTGSLGGAVECFTVFANPLPQYFDKITNVVSDPNCVPQPGDVVVWGAMPGFGPYGHIGICLSSTSTSFTSFDQNWPVNSPAHSQSHNYNYVLGWLRPKQTGGGNMAADLVEIYRNCYILLTGTWPSQDNINAFLANPEKRPYTYLQQQIYNPLIATKDAEINNLKTSVAQLTADNTNLKAQLTSLNSQLDSLSKQVAEQIDEIAKLKASQKPTEPSNGNEQATLNFVQAVIAWLRGLLK